MKAGVRLHVTGIVQGVGFRPFVYNLARQLDLAGWVRNTSAGVEIELDGPMDDLRTFSRAVKDEAPPLSRIDEITITYGPAAGFRDFEIRESASLPEAFQPISPDVAVCPDCLRELFDPTDRRHRYPFINCTNCGPRFTIIKDIPYDRALTTMAGFAMCPDCAGEYHDPTDRRFHAQPIACPVCGPRVWLETAGAGPDAGSVTGDAAIRQAQQLLADGRIVAVKGLGGFHLACDATKPGVVAELRRRKLRVDKPFAIMVRDRSAAASQCIIGEAELSLLESAARPVVLLRRGPHCTIAAEVAPGQEWLGTMLPYTPLHHLLLEPHLGSPAALVMTSGNLSEEPIATDNAEARERLASLADAFLMHDRDIHTRCDDSVVRVFAAPAESQPDTGSQARDPMTYPIRRSRGYAPFPVRLPWSGDPVLGVGAELKNTFCLTNRSYAFMSQHIGDLENYETLRSFREGIAHFESLFRVTPAAIAHDLHPDYLATRYALERASTDGITAVAIQHHHAHIAACMAEHGFEEGARVIGVAFDGTGFGTDGAIWGGEILLASYADFERPLHFRYFPLPGGDAAIRHPARTALALLWSLGVNWDDGLYPVRHLQSEELSTLRTQLERRLNTLPTSSLGRLFDAAASLAGIRQSVNYEAQAAIEFEAMVDESEPREYTFDLHGEEIEYGAALLQLLEDVQAGIRVPVVAARFHNGIAGIVRRAAVHLRAMTGIDQVVLSGGVWQNITLLRRALSLLQAEDFRVYIHREVPTNDGGLSLGQAVIAASRMRAGYVPGSSGTDH